MRLKRAEFEDPSLAILYAFICAFGAVVVVFLTTSRPGHRPEPEPAPSSIIETVPELQRQLFELQDQTKVVSRELTHKEQQLAAVQAKMARLSSPGKPDETVPADSAVKAQLQVAYQELTEEMRRLGARRRPAGKTDVVGGIPVDSEYVIFVIDTSGSMFQFAWERLMQEMMAVLNMYPHVKGLQILNDHGFYMFETYRRQWIPDTPAVRRIILDRLPTWNPFSNSSPVEGIETALRTFYDPGKRVSIYYFGDDFTGNSIRRVLEDVERLNPKDGAGVPQIRIHCFGFPVQFANTEEQITGIRYAALMREMTRRNMGTFVGLTDFRPRR